MSEYRTAQVVQATVNPTQPFIDAMIDAANAHPAWEYVGSFRTDGEAAGTSQYRNHIFKNLGTVNSFGQDYYLILTTNNAVTLSATGIWIQVAEQMSVHPTIPTARKFLHITANSTTSSLVPTAQSAYSSDTVPVTVQTEAVYSFASNVTSYVYRVLLTNNAAILNVAGAGYYCGLFEPFFTHPNEFPLIITSSSGASDGVFTRAPGQTTALSNVFGSSSTAYSVRFGAIGDPAVTARPGPIGSRIMVSRYQGVAGTWGAERGLLYGMLGFTHNGGFTFSGGDTLTLSNGDVYELLITSVPFSWANKSAP